VKTTFLVVLLEREHSFYDVPICNHWSDGVPWKTCLLSKSQGSLFQSDLVSENLRSNPPAATRKSGEQYERYVIIFKFRPNIAFHVL
jgi:hypothetical protein